MTDPTRIYRLWRTSGVMCALGALEFCYVAYIRHAWWPAIPAAGLAICAGLAFRKARVGRGAP